MAQQLSASPESTLSRWHAEVLSAELAKDGAVHRSERSRLGRIAKSRASAVSLCAADIRRRQGRTTERHKQKSALSRAVRCRQARRSTVLTHRTAHKIDARSFSVRWPQHQSTNALRACVAIRTRIERLATAVDRQHASR